MQDERAIRIGLEEMLRGAVDDFATMGAPEEDVTRCRRDVEAVLVSMGRLHGWRERNNLPVPQTRGLSVG